MSNPLSIQVADRDEAAALARWAEEHGPKMGAPVRHAPRAEIATKHFVENRGGVIATTSHVKTEAAVTFTPPVQTRPGFIEVPGMGETPIDAAKAAGLLPRNWQDGDPNPFFDPAQEAPKGAPKAGVDGARQDAAEGGQDQGKDAAQSIAEKTARQAGEILDKVAGVIGESAALDLLQMAAETGDLPTAADIPDGFTELQVKQVHNGYIAQANDRLAKVGSTVTMLEEVLTEDELGYARKATITGRDEELQELGRLAITRLANLPKADPEGFSQMVADMKPDERKCIKWSDHRQEWMVTIPGYPEMVYATAVHTGLVRV